MASSLSNLVNNLSEGIRKIKRKYGHDDKNCETCRMKYKYCHYFVKHANFGNDLLEQKKCLCCNKNYQQKFCEKLKERFLGAYKFSNHDNSKFFYGCGKVFTLMNLWMIGKGSMRYYSVKKNIFIRYQKRNKANNKYMKDYNKNKGLLFLQYWDVNSLYGWDMLQRLVVNSFEWIEDTF